MRIALLSCTKRKKSFPCRASEMYMESDNFRYAYQYAKLTCDRIFILSSKFGLLSETDRIEPYDETLQDKTLEERKLWARNVLQKLSRESSFERDEFLVLTGKFYNEFLLPHFENYELPLKGLEIGKWVPKLKLLIDGVRLERSSQATNNPRINTPVEPVYNAGKVLHRAFNGMPRWNWSNIDHIPFTNGIYVFFENGEKYLGMDRIVRVGTHTSEGNLKNRLKNHYVNENKDGSIFRKNIGLALLHKRQDPYETIWAKNTSIPGIKQSLEQDLKWEYKMEIEKEVTSYLQQNMTFVCFPVDSAEARLRLEDGIIATLNHSVGFSSSTTWLGNYSPKSQISDSGLWNIKGSDGKPLSTNDLSKITALGERFHGTMPSADHRNFGQTEVNLSHTTEELIKPQDNQGLPTMSLTSQIQLYIQGILDQCRQIGVSEAVLISGNIHRKMGLENRMPTVCQAMRKIMKVGDEVLFETPSGNSSTLRIIYRLG